MKKKLCSILLALTMVLTLLPVSALAHDGTAVAEVSGTQYESLAKAVEAANDGDTVTLLNDATLDGTLNITKAITLDGASHKITGNATAKASFISVTTNGDFTMKNCTILPSSKVDANATINLQVKGKVTVDNCVFGTPDDTNRYMYNGLEFSQDANYPMVDGTTISNCTFHGASFRHNFISFYRMAEGATININNNKFLNANWDSTNAIRVSNYSNVSATINLNGNTYSDLGTSGGEAYAGLFFFEELTSYHDDFTKLTLNISNLDASSATGGQLYYVYSDAERAIISTNQPVINSDSSINMFYDAKIGNTYYKFLTDAYAALPRNVETDSAPTTITLLKDCAGGGMGSDSDHGMNYVIDFNGHTYTVGAPAVGSTGTVSQGIRVLKDSKAKFMNGTLKAANYNGLVQVVHTYGDVTFQDFTVDATEDPYAWAAVEPDNGNFKILGNSSILAHTGDYGLYTAFWPRGGYVDGTTVTIDTTGTITGKMAYEWDDKADTASQQKECKAVLNIKNGNFNITDIETLFTNSIPENLKVAKIYISGGTFTIDPTKYVADGYIARKDGDAQYTVVAKSNLTAGVYTSDPSSALAPGYVSYKNSDNTYTVYYPVPVTPGNNNNSSSTTTKNPDGSTTTTTTDKTTGTVTETTKNPDGSTTTVETKKDGSVTATNKTANGSVGTVKTDANGNSEISANISAADVSAAAKKNEPVAAPVSVAPAASPAAAPVIKLSVPANAGEVSVVIPVTNAQQGTVAIKVNPDGTEEIIKTSVVTKDGVVLGVKGSAQIKIVNNDKDFSDTVGHWAESDVDFVSARELFTGTAPQTFSPEAATTRGMVVTVLARLAGESTDGGANWYDKGCAWAVTNGVSDGTDPNGTVTREQLAAMLYRYFGSPAVSGSLSFADASSVSEYAHDAMQWCVNNGIINGMDGLLNPQGQATRAQVSAMFARYIHLAATK